MVDLREFALNKFRSLFAWERRQAEAVAKETLNQLQQAGEIDLADCLLEAYHDKEIALLFQFPEILTAFSGLWEATRDVEGDSYHKDNPPDRAATGTSVGSLNK